MKKQHREPELSVELKRTEWEMGLEGECVLHCALSCPELSGTWGGISAINRYYSRVTHVWRRRWERELYCFACLDLADRRERGRPFRAWKAELETQVTFQKDGVLSLWQEGREQRGYESPLLLRRADSWSLAQGAPILPTSVFGGGRRWKRMILQQVREQVRMRLAGGESLLDPDCETRLRRSFRADNFYLTEDGAAVFFPMYALGAGAEGIPVFDVCLNR